jgi:general secretion pathway protein K
VNGEAMFGRAKGERGVVLVMVLWISVFLFGVATQFALFVRDEGIAARRFVEESDGYYLALAGFQEGLYRALRQASQRRNPELPQAEEAIDGSWREGELGGGRYRVRLLDESGRIDLNRANEEVLRRVFSNLGIAEAERAELVDSILDWRDPDDLHRASGAESDYYLSLPTPYRSKNGPFDSVEELLWVRGVTPALFYGAERNGARQVGLREIFTVDSRIDRVNLRTAPPEVIHALTGMPLGKAEAFVEERRKLSEKTLLELLRLLGVSAGEPASRYFVFVPPSVVTIEAEGFRGDGEVRHRLRGTVRLSGGARGYELLRWIDRVPLYRERERA